MTRLEGLQAWRRDQSAVSLAAGGLGAAGIVVVVVGSIVLLMANGLVPNEQIYETATSRTQTLVLWIGLALGAAASALGFASYKRMTTKAARETAISGGALGVQAVALAAFYLWFRGGDKFDTFVRINFSFDVLAEFAREFVAGARNTVILAAGGEAFGIVLGLVLAMLILSRRVVV
ncbi:MAG: hypothetical protein M3161_06005, partial [Actinomycetota bacterium]|nr:hypothetical protein [Actinomycetota bacterium]